MAVSFLKHVALEIPTPDLDKAAAFYTDFGLLFNVEDTPPEAPLAEEPEFRINSPGHYNRVNASVMQPRSRIPDPQPRRLGHVLLFTPDEVGVGGCRMIEKGHVQGWGFGRHAIGSNFFHYVRDPWGSYVEYYSDIDYIADS